MASIVEECDAKKSKDKTSIRNETFSCGSFIKNLFFCVLFPLCWKKTSNDISLDDLKECDVSNLSNALGNKIEKNWLLELQNSKKIGANPNFLNVLCKTFIRGYIYDGILLVILCLILKPAIPVFLALLIEEFDSSNKSKETAGLYAFALIIVSLLSVIIQFHAVRRTQQRGMKLRMACCSLVYRKMLKLSVKALNQTTAGQIINIISNDVAKFDLVLLNLHYVWIMPLQLILLTYLIYLQANIAGVIGVFTIIILSLPAQVLFGKLFAKYRLKIAEQTDERIRLMHEIIKGIQVIKMYVWEKYFEKSILSVRTKELFVLLKCSQIRGLSMNFLLIIERASLLTTLLMYTFMGNMVTASVVFSLAQFYNKVQETIAFYFPTAISLGAECLVTIKRIENFLMLDESKDPVLLTINRNTEGTEVNEIHCFENKGFENGVNDISLIPDKIIDIHGVTAAWTTKEETLVDISLTIKKGKLYAVIGSIGSGKTSFLHLLLNEIPIKEGTVKLSKRVSYGSQDPWLFVDTIRNNILFGEVYNSERYNKVIEVCALNKDFEKFPFKDQSLVGERGISLSGGQKARISLARTLYKEADVYLLDDPLSAVDTNVGSYLFQEGIKNFLENKTRILVTHHLHYLKNVDYIIALKNGRIEQFGTYDDLKSITSVFNNPNHQNETPENNKYDGNEAVTKSALNRRDTNLKKIEEIDLCVAQVEPTEETRTGDAIMSIFFQYWKSGNCKCLIIFMIIFMILAQGSATLCDFWVAYWSGQANEKFANKSDSSVNISSSYKNNFDMWEKIGYFNPIEYMYIYSIILGLLIIMSTIRSYLFFVVTLKVAKELHNKMFHKILYTRMRFFNDNSSGKILNRFSKDMGAIDDMIPQLMLQSIQIVLVFCSILILVLITNIWLLIPMTLVIFMFWFTLHIYFTKAQSIRVLETIYRSPVYSFISSSLNGIVTIRTSKSQQNLIKEFDRRLDSHSTSCNSYIVFSCTLGFWLDVVCCGFLCAVCFVFVYFDDETSTSSNVGLAISQTLILLGMLQFGVRLTSETFVQLISAERIIHYTKLDAEENLILTDKFRKKENSWPSSGKISFKNVFLKYHENREPILKDINLKISNGVKVGIVGRTGAGKSSLIAALFRLAEIEGNVEIDGMNTKNIPLEDVRSSISIIPQDPMLFSATLRNNLDPLQKYDDTKIWSTIEIVGLKNKIESLDYKIAEDGSNLSAGQKQLICLARALLQNNKIIVMDEATANIDPETDSFIQKIIRENFTNSTVLTIAHRLNTIIDSDFVLVIDNGFAVNFGHPYLLLKDKNSVFYNIVQQTGPKMAENLLNVAKKLHKQKLPPRDFK